MVSSSTKRRAIKDSIEEGLGNISQCCIALGLPRSSFYHQSQRNDQSIQKEKKVIELSEKHPRYGYRRITALMRRAGDLINTKSVQRQRSKYGLQVKKRQRKTRRVVNNESKRLRANRPNHVWSWDFVYDQTANGSSVRILSIVDEYTRQCYSIRPRRSYKAQDVINVIEEKISEYGAPALIRSDNGPEFISYAIQDWLKQQGVGTHYIKPGSPWEQPYVESFHDKLRDELLNRELIFSIEEAEVLLEGWRKEYNSERPHSSLGYKTPNEYALEEKRKKSGRAVTAEVNEIPNRQLGGFIYSSAPYKANERQTNSSEIKV